MYETLTTGLCVLMMILAIAKITIVVLRPKSRFEESGLASLSIGLTMLPMAVLGIVSSVKAGIYAQMPTEQPLIMLPWMLGLVGCLLLFEGIVTAITYRMDERRERITASPLPRR